ncbi:MAG: class I SAM-dependent methyltransferase [Patescibacteria group bacterium]
MYPEIAQRLLEEAEQQYDAIAEDFSATRAGLWPELERLRELVPAGGSVLDVGCGNGRLYGLFAGTAVRYTGVDISSRMIGIAQTRWSDAGAKFVKASALNLPFPDQSFNAVVLAAALHHVPGSTLREQALREAARVLLLGGILFVTVWNLFQRRYLWYVLENNFLKLTGRNPLDWNDAQIPWKRGVWVSRYCHAFFPIELSRLAEKAGLTVTEISYSEKNRRNIILIARKNQL